MAEPPPAIAPKMPNALPRSDGSVKVVASSASADGASSAPKTPCSARAATSTPKDPAAPPRAEAAAKPSRPPTNAHLRPNRSPSLPPSSSRRGRWSASSRTRLRGIFHLIVKRKARQGFEQLSARQDYYGPGRHALILKLYDLQAWPDRIPITTEEA